MVILASLSGIQDFLFDVREAGGKQARSLRHRSFRVQLLAEAVALRLLDAARLPHDRLIFCAAAKACIDAGDLKDEAAARVRATAEEIQGRLLKFTHGRLRLSVEIGKSADGFAQMYRQAGRKLAERKLRPWQPASASDGWRNESLVVLSAWNPDAEANEDAEIGTRLQQANYLSIYRAGGALGNQAMDLVGLAATLDREAPSRSPELISVSNLRQPDEHPNGISADLFHPRRLARHVPRDEHGRPIEFVDLASRARGAHMLGVLKADADALGEAIGATLNQAGADGAAALRRFSDALDHFFAETLEQEQRRKQKPGEQWNLIYTVFSGGDDMLVVGPWNVVLDFAGHARGLFEKAFGVAATNRPCASPLTISAGVAIIKPKYPVHLAATQADLLLDRAKGEAAPGAEKPKDQCSAFEQVWKWTDHEKIIEDGKRLADWVDTGIIQLGWLHTLLELALLRRGQAGLEYKGIHPAVATSRLAYHVARNWPRKRDNPRNDAEETGNAAREWIETVLGDFDAPPAEQRGRVKYMPAFLRYALLATRGGGSEER